jgi:DNA-binding NtrC family response regulator
MGQPKILLLDDDKNLLRVLSYHVREAGFAVTPLSSPTKALELLGEESFDLVITDLRMPEMDGLEFLGRLRVRDQNLPVIVLTAYGSIDKAVEAVRQGASDFLAKPVEKAELVHAIGRVLQMADLIEQNKRLARAVEAKFEFKGIVGTSKRFREVLEMAAQLATVDTTVLIQGESGTGKELLARAIHFNSTRRNRPFVVVNCGAIPSDLLESELFGHRRGAFTGAVADKKGKFEVADTGSIFLDEIGELPANMQVKLLRVLQQRELDVVGDPHTRSVDVRVLAATNRDLQQMMGEGLFREDLFYRLSVAPLHVPPLRHRREDIPLLLHEILDRVNSRMSRDVRIEDDAIERMQRYDWPGNIRELENLLERLVVFNRSGVIAAGDLPESVRAPRHMIGRIGFELPEDGLPLEDLEREILAAALEKHGWNQSQTARYLAITRNTLIYRMQKYNLRENDGPEAVASDSAQRE